MSKLKTLLEARSPIKKIEVLGMSYVDIPAAVLFTDAPVLKKLGFPEKLKILRHCGRQECCWAG